MPLHFITRRKFGVTHALRFSDRSMVHSTFLIVLLRLALNLLDGTALLPIDLRATALCHLYRSYGTITATTLAAVVA